MGEEGIYAGKGLVVAGRSVACQGIDYISKYIIKLEPGFPLSYGKEEN